MPELVLRTRHRERMRDDTWLWLGDGKVDQVAGGQRFAGEFDQKSIPTCNQIVCRSLNRPVTEPMPGIAGEVTGASPTWR